VFHFLMRSFLHTNDKWTALFVLLSIEEMDLDSEEEEEFKKCIDFKQKLYEYFVFDKDIFARLTSGTVHPELFVEYQLGLTAQEFVNRLRYLFQPKDKILSITQKKVHPSDTKNPRGYLSDSVDNVTNVGDYKREYSKGKLKVSTDSLSARCDWGWQSARSKNSVDENANVYFYQVLLITSGIQRIGWYSDGTNDDETQCTMMVGKVGDSWTSIGFDGFNRCIWYDRRQYAVENMKQRWQIGDVVSCVIDRSNKTFKFYLNSEEMISKGLNEF